MVLGICTRYNQHESSFAAIRLADAARDAAIDVSIYTMTERPMQLGSHWDYQLAKASQLPFTKWAETVTHVLWTTIPHFEQICWAKDHGKCTTILVNWHELTSFDVAVMAEADYLLCPSRACFDLLRTNSFHNVICLPWDAGLPLYNKHRGYTPEQLRLLLPLWDGNARRTELTVLNVLERSLRRYPHVHLTAVFNSSSICSTGKRKLREMEREFPDRVVCAKGVRPAQRPLLFQSHDLTVWPTHFESLCLVGIQSIEMGTPVIAFRFTPITEILTNVNGISVGCGETTNDIGVPKAVPDYDLFDEILACALNDVDFIRHLQQQTQVGLPERRSIFTRQFSRILF